MAFKVGDLVFWESQAAGIRRRKEGEVIEVVPRHAMPRTKLSAEPGGSRDHESYVVKAKAIGTKLERAKKYWPVASLLHPAPAALAKLDNPTPELRAEMQALVHEHVEDTLARAPAPKGEFDKIMVGVDMGAENVEQTAVVYQVSDAQGVLRVVSKEEYEQSMASLLVDKEG